MKVSAKCGYFIDTSPRMDGDETIAKAEAEGVKFTYAPHCYGKASSKNARPKG